MQEIAVITLATMMAISGWFHDGLKALNEKKYGEAIVQLTKVYEKDVPGNTLREQALYFRAQAYMGKNDKARALGDLLTLVKSAGDPQLRKQSLDLYKKWGGDPTKLMPKQSPTTVWKNFVTTAQKGELKACLAMSSGMFKELLVKGSGGDGEKLADNFTNTTFTPVKEEIGKGKDAGKAWVTLQVDGTNNGIIVWMIFDQKNRRWTLDSLKNVVPKKKPEKAPVEK